MVQHIESKSKMRERAQQAVDLAMKSEWAQAAATNRDILAAAPRDFEALNRLGKALSELGKYSEARSSFQRVLELAPSNAIARKNLDRIRQLRDGDTTEPRQKSIAPHFFIEEIGKTGVTALVNLAPWRSLATLTPGETVSLKMQDHKLIVETALGHYIGTVDPKIGLRLIRMQRAGNRYEAAVSSLASSEVRVIIKESYQHPSQIGKLSFPARPEDDFSPYVWEGMLEDDEEPNTNPSEDWADESEAGLEELLRSTSRKPRGRRKGAGAGKV